MAAIDLRPRRKVAATSPRPEQRLHRRVRDGRADSRQARQLVHFGEARAGDVEDALGADGPAEGAVLRGGGQAPEGVDLLLHGRGGAREVEVLRARAGPVGLAGVDGVCVRFEAA